MQRFEELKTLSSFELRRAGPCNPGTPPGLNSKSPCFFARSAWNGEEPLAEVLCDSLELKAFRFLFTDETKHKDIFGIQSIQALKEDKDVLITRG